MKVIAIVILSLGLMREARAAEINYSAIADAIYHAEGSKNHPYGIMKPYCTAKTPDKCRKGCLQTIEKRYNLWIKGVEGESVLNRKLEAFIAFLADSYAPLNAPNDPKGLNHNWTKNVIYYLNHPKEVSHEV